MVSNFIDMSVLLLKISLLNYRSSEFSFNSTVLLKILSHYSAYYCNLWFNSHIKIGTVPVFFKKCSEKFHQKIV